MESQINSDFATLIRMMVILFVLWIILLAILQLKLMKSSSLKGIAFLVLSGITLIS